MNVTPRATTGDSPRSPGAGRPIAHDVPGRCRGCGFDRGAQGHRSELEDGTPTGCQDEGPWLLVLARRRSDAARAEVRTMARANVTASTPDREWQTFLSAVRADAAAHDGLVSQNRIREAIGFRWTTVEAKRRYSQMWSRARREHVLVETDLTERSTDHAGGNAHRIVPVLRLKSYGQEAAA